MESPLRKRRNVRKIGLSPPTPDVGNQAVTVSPRSSPVAILPYISLDKITASSRGFSTIGRLSYKAIGEKSAKGDMKMNAKVLDQNGRELAVFTLGREQFVQWAQVDYDDVIELSGFKPAMREGKLTLVAYAGQEIVMRRAEGGDISQPTEDSLNLSMLEHAKQSSVPNVVEMVVYIMRIDAASTRPMWGRELKCQDIFVQDQNNHGSIIELMEEAVGLATKGTFALLKGVKTIRGSLQVWGTSMFVKAPEDLEFDVAETLVREV